MQSIKEVIIILTPLCQKDPSMFMFYHVGLVYFQEKGMLVAISILFFAEYDIV